MSVAVLGPLASLTPDHGELRGVRHQYPSSACCPRRGRRYCAEHTVRDPQEAVDRKLGRTRTRTMVVRKWSRDRAASRGLTARQAWQAWLRIPSRTSWPWRAWERACMGAGRLADPSSHGTVFGVFLAANEQGGHERWEVPGEGHTMRYCGVGRSSSDWRSSAAETDLQVRRYKYLVELGGSIMPRRHPNNPPTTIAARTRYFVHAEPAAASRGLEYSVEVARPQFVPRGADSGVREP